MIEIPRAAARHYWSALRQLLTGVPRRTWPCIQIFADHQGLRIAAHTDKVGLEFRLPGALPTATLNFPGELLRTAAEGRGESVAVEAGSDGVVIARWRDGEVPRQASFERPRPAAVVARPHLPTNWVEQPSTFCAALRTVMEVTDLESLRYALSCVQLDGDAGTFTATDGRQILSHGGWNLGFAGAVLVPANKVFGNRELVSAEAVRIGKTDSHFVVQAGAWTVWIALNREGRFPRVNDLLAAGDSAPTRLMLDLDDRRFLLENLARLPERSDENGAVTVELNGRVAIRAQDADSSPPTELVLSRSSRVGDEVRFCTDRRLLSRALELGFREIAIQNAEQPVVCRDEHRTYLWALLTPESAIGPATNAITIESPRDVSTSPVTARSQPPARSRLASTNRIPPISDMSTVEPSTQGEVEPANIDPLIESAERVRSVLRDAASQVSELIVALRRHRRQTKTLQSALPSLRALQTLDA